MNDLVKFQEKLKKCHPDFYLKKTNDIYCIESGEEPVILYTAGIHGDEPSGPNAVLKFIKKFYNNVKILPMCNPEGFIKNKRRAGSFDLNRHFNGSEREQNIAILEEVKSRPIKFLCSLHEHPSVYGFYIYESGLSDELCEEILAIGAKYFPIRKRHGTKVINGRISLNKLDGDRSLEDWCYTQGIPYVTVETPGKRLLKDRVNCTLEIMKKVYAEIKGI